MDKCSIKQWLLSCAAFGTLTLTGCSSVQTTNPGVVGVERSQFMSSLISSESLNQQYAAIYQDTILEASDAGALETNSSDSKRLNEISKRLIAQVPHFRPDAVNWNWEVVLIRNDEINASCGPGGKIIFYSGIIDRLKLNNDEIAAVMGHEIAHALREHSREAATQSYGVNIASKVAGVLGASGPMLQAASLGTQYLMKLPNSRQNENEADLIGLELMARAGYDPDAAVTLWQKMADAKDGSPPEFMSTHPSSETRIQNLLVTVPKVKPLYNQSNQTSQAGR